jgi:hypothetical protein
LVDVARGQIGIGGAARLGEVVKRVGLARHPVELDRGLVIIVPGVRWLGGRLGLAFDTMSGIDRCLDARNYCVGQNFAWRLRRTRTGRSWHSPP